MKQSVTHGRFQSVLYCTDFSANADHAFPYAVEQVRLAGGQLTLLHVVPDPEAQFWNTYLYELDDVDRKAGEDMDRRIEESYRANLPPTMDMHVMIRGGTVHEEILRAAEERGVDLIVIGRQGHGSFGRMIFGNETEKIVRRAKCPVLVVPMAEGRGGAGE